MIFKTLLYRNKTCTEIFSIHPVQSSYESHFYRQAKHLNVLSFQQ